MVSMATRGISLTGGAGLHHLFNQNSPSLTESQDEDDDDEGLKTASNYQRNLIKLKMNWCNCRLLLTQQYRTRSAGEETT